MATKVVAPNVWGWLSDRTGKRLTIVRLGCFLACLCFIVLLFRNSFWWMVLAVSLYSFFWNAVLAQFEVITLNYLGLNAHYYGRIRVWGSVGFVVVVVGLGVLFDWLDIRYLPIVVMVFLALIWLSSLSIKEPVIGENKRTSGSFIQTVKQPPVLFFLIGCFLLQASHGSYYTFYSVFLEGLSYSRTEIGFLWALGVLAEVLIFLVMHRVLRHFSLRLILLASLFLTIIRWWLIGCFAESLTVLIVAQLLHAFSFGTFHGVSIELIRRYFDGNIQGQGQALYSAVGFGAGGAVGALLSGATWSISPVLSFTISALLAAFAWLCVYLGMRGKEVEASLTHSI
jgi:PPP family 3-phenylpropionic acid transporter